MPSDLLNQLEKRRQELGMPLRVLAARSKIGLRTAYRIFKGGDDAVSIAAIEAVARVLMVDVVCRNKMSSEALIRLRAIFKARQMVAEAQGTSALEGQGVSLAQRRRLERMLISKLLTASPSVLWG